MARSFIAGGQAATQLQAGKPFLKRVVRIGGDSGYLRSDGFTCEVVSAGDNQGAINFRDVFSPDWNANADGTGGELLMIEFPTTTRKTQVLLEEAHAAGSEVEPGNEPAIRCKVAFLAEDQDVNFAAATATAVNPISNANFIEIEPGETATIDSRTKAIFILIQKFVSGTTPESHIFNNTPALVQGAPGSATDAAVLLVTSILDHEPKAGRDF